MVSSADGLDELSTAGATHVVEVDGGTMRSYDVAPEDVGLARAGHADAGRRHARTSTRSTTRRIFAGEPGPPRDLAVLNAGAAIYVAGRADDARGRRPGRRGGDRRRAPPRPRSTRSSS